MGRRAHPPKWFFLLFFFIILYSHKLFYNRRPILLPADLTKSVKIDRLLWPLLINNHLEPLKTSVRTRFHGLWASFDHPRISATYNLRHRAFAFVLEGCGLLWPPPPINNPTSPEIVHLRSFSEVVGFLWASATAATINNPQNSRNQVLMLDFGCYYPSNP